MKINDEKRAATIFIVAQTAIVRADLESVLKAIDRFVVTGSAAEMPPAPTRFSAGQIIDVILVNIERENDFYNLLEFLSEGAPEEIDFPAVVALFPPELQSSEPLAKALKSGVRGVLPHNASADEISAAVNSAHAGLLSFTPDMAEVFLSLLAETDSGGGAIENNGRVFEDEMIETLTPREAEILGMLGEGASNKSIAYQLNISEHTVKFHVASIFAKLGVNTRTEAVMRGLRNNLILL